MVRSLRSRQTEGNGSKEQTSSSDEFLQITPRRVWVIYKKPVLVIRGLLADDWPKVAQYKKFTSPVQENDLKRKGPPTRISPRKKQRVEEQDESANGEMSLRVVHKNGQTRSEANSQVSIEAAVNTDLEEAHENGDTDLSQSDKDENTKGNEKLSKPSKALPQTRMQESRPPSRVATPLPVISKPAAPLRDPNELLPADLPPPFMPIQSEPASEPFSDPAAAILYSEYPPLPPLAAFLGPMTSHPLSTLSTTTLAALALNTHRALSAWQDVYILLDQHTAPIANPPKKPVNGGRIPMEKRAWEILKEAELAAFCAPAAPPTTGRGLRRRRNAEDLLGIPSSTHGVLSEDDTGVGKRARKPVRRFDIGNAPRGDRQHSQALFSHLNPASYANGHGVPVKRGPRVAALISQDYLEQRPGSSTPELSTEAETSDQNGNSSSENDREDRRRRRAGAIGRGGGKVRGGRGGRASGRGGSKVATSAANGTNTALPAVPSTANGVSIAPAPAIATEPAERKPRVKSEKRSESMTAWWAQRKRKAAAEAKLIKPGTVAAAVPGSRSIQGAAASIGTSASGREQPAPQQQQQQRNHGPGASEPRQRDSNSIVQSNIVRLQYAPPVQPANPTVPAQQQQNQSNHYQARQPQTRGDPPPPHPGAGAQMRNILHPPSTATSTTPSGSTTITAAGPSYPDLHPRHPQPYHPSSTFTSTSHLAHPHSNLTQHPHPHPQPLLPQNQNHMQGSGSGPGYMNGSGNTGYNNPNPTRPGTGTGNGWGGGGGYT